MRRLFVRWVQCAAAVLLLAAAVTWSISTVSMSTARAGQFVRSNAVGGVVVDPNGVLRAATVDELGYLLKVREKQAAEFSGELVATPLRKVSLRRLQEEYLARKARAQTPFVTEDMQYLGGLTRIQYVFVYPEQKDIVLAGPAEGIKVNKLGHFVGSETGHPLLQLDQLLIALRTAESAGREVISCSIDPTKEGVEAFDRVVKQTKQFDKSVLRRLEEAMGPQTITITGVPANSDFARTMVAADYRMKRLAMGFDRSPVKGLTSYLDMIKGPGPAIPRWWMAPNYEALVKDPDGVAWELRGKGVKVMTEDSIFAETGEAKRTGKASAIAQRWADNMTAKYDELSVHYPIFGELRNVMDMAVIGAVIVKENLREKAGLDMSVLMNDRDFTSTGDYPVPKRAPTIVNHKQAGSTHIVTASGGVEINSWKVADKTQTSQTISQTRQSAAHTGGKWWWN
jgi:hypothetical protein